MVPQPKTLVVRQRQTSIAIPLFDHSHLALETNRPLETTTEIYWLRMFIHELGIGLSALPVLWYDNVGAIALASNPVFHARIICGG